MRHVVSENRNRLRAAPRTPSVSQPRRRFHVRTQKADEADSCVTGKQIWSSQVGGIWARDAQTNLMLKIAALPGFRTLCHSDVGLRVWAPYQQGAELGDLTTLPSTACLSGITYW